MQYHTTQAPAGQLYDPADVLHDLSATGRENPWAELKMQSQIMATALQLIDEGPGQRMALCADTLFFRRKEAGGLVLDTARFCRARLCPVCQWRRSLKYAGQAYQIVQWLDKRRASQHAKPYAWLMLTLTIRNVAGDQLSAGLDQLQKGWRAISRSKPWARVVRGAMRSVEITYNADREDYHPHMHIMCAVLPSYFSSREYIAQDEWRTLWQESAGLDYAPQVDVHRVRRRGEASDSGALWAAIAETMKYTCKSRDLLDPSDVDKTVEVLSHLYRAAKGRRFAGFTGEVREARKALKLDDVEDGDLIHVGIQDTNEDTAPVIAWGWYTGPRLYLKMPGRGE